MPFRGLTFQNKIEIIIKQCDNIIIGIVKHALGAQRGEETTTYKRIMDAFTKEMTFELGFER